MKQRTLHLTLSKEPFEVMVTGEKLIEFRKPTDWIRSRLFDRFGNRKEYDQVKFVNGYGKDKPFFIAIFNGFDNAQKPCKLSYSNSLEVEVEKGDYLIYLGEILESKNVKPKP